ALMLNVPTESELAQIMSPVDPAFIHTRRKAFRAGIEQALPPQLRDLFEALFPDNLNNPLPFSPSALQAGRRALRNGLLDLIMSAWADGDEEVRRHCAHLAQRHYQLSDNMTDPIAGMNALSQV